MTGIYLTWLVDELRAAGCSVEESGTTNGWQNRARSSGGFPSTPLGVQWHHTASSTTPANDLSYMINGSDDAPVGNVLLDRNGTYWPIAAGASNTAGKGGPLALSRGTIPVDSANTRSVAIECANNGVGEPWPQVQVDAYFRGSNAINARLGNRPDDVFTHSLGAGDGWTDRKIDPATASAVQGGWRPSSVNGSGTWSLADIRNECNARAGQSPAPQPPPIGDDEMLFDGFWRRDNSDAVYAIWRNGTKQWMTDVGYLNAMNALQAINGATPDQLSVRVQNDPSMFAAFGLVIGPREPNTDEWGNKV